MITLLLLFNIKIYAIGFSIVFLIIFLWMLYQMSVLEHNANKWRKDYFRAKDEAVEMFNENLELKAQIRELNKKLNP